MSHPYRSQAVMLTPEDEAGLVERMRAGDRRARDELITAHLPLAVKRARRFARLCHRDVEDLVQEAAAALIKAADAFDPSRGARFALCAKWWISSALNQFVRANLSIVATPGSTNSRREFWGQLRIGNYAMDLSLDAPLSADSDATLLDAIADENAIGEEGMIEVLNQTDQLGVVLAAISRLPDREAAIIKRRYFCDGASVATLEDLAREFAVSRERIRQVEERALRRLLGIIRQAGRVRVSVQHRGAA